MTKQAHVAAFYYDEKVCEIFVTGDLVIQYLNGDKFPGTDLFVGDSAFMKSSVPGQSAADAMIEMIKEQCDGQGPEWTYEVEVFG